MENADTIYAAIPGGRELLAWFGCVPSFHDAEIISLCLHRRAPSSVLMHTWNNTSEADESGYYVLDKHAVVKFTFEEIVDLQFDGFSHQNVIYGLSLRHAPDRPERRTSYARDPSPNDFEIWLEPCFGIDGFIRCRRVSVDFTPGKPNDLRE